jgi:GIY-YIG catalytic domain
LKQPSQRRQASTPGGRGPERLVDATPPIPAVHPPSASAAWALLYVGIAPKRPSSTGVDRTIATRISKDHRGGNIGGSTFRQSLAALLLAPLGLVAKSGHGRARLVDEKPLSTWIDTNCALTTATTAKPWTIEDTVIRELRAPLNLRPGYHPYRFVVHEARASLRRDCGL